MQSYPMPLMWQIVGQPILAAAGFLRVQILSDSPESRLKGGCRQDCLPHNQCRIPIQTLHVYPASLLGAFKHSL